MSSKKIVPVNVPPMSGEEMQKHEDLLDEKVREVQRLLRGQEIIAEFYRKRTQSRSSLLRRLTAWVMGGP